MGSGPEELTIRVPQQDLRKLSFCGHTPKKMSEWAEGLPKVNTGEMARLLYGAIQELNRLQLDPLARYHLMEILRPQIHYVCNSLSKHYLNQSIVLPEKASKVANLAQALQNHLAMGYKISIVQGIPKIRDNEISLMIASAIHRTLSVLSHTLLRCFQLYIPTPLNLWREVHRLYMLAEHHKLLSHEIEDHEFKEIKSSNIPQTYIRALLLGKSKPNQLRQKEIELVFQATEVWASLSSISKTLEKSHLFVVNLTADSGPLYSSLVQDKEKCDDYRFIDCSKLADQLQNVLRAPDHFSGTSELNFYLPRGFNDDILRHLIQSWSQLTQRSFPRTTNKGHIHICLGLSATHYYKAGKTDFETVLRGYKESGLVDDEPENVFLNRPAIPGLDNQESAKDVWSQAFDSSRSAAGLDKDKLKKISVLLDKDGNKMEDPSSLGDVVEDLSHISDTPDDTEKPLLFDSFACNLINTSPGGFCLSWGDNVPKQVKTGEVVGVREDGQDEWSIGVIRWVKQFRNKGARMGLELLAPNATPVGSKVLNKTGSNTEYMRALILPELKAIGQPATLITPKIAFHVGNKILLNEQGVEDKVQLLKQVSSTASFSQFQFKYYSKKKPIPTSKSENAQQNKPDDFDSIWSSI